MLTVINDLKIEGNGFHQKFASKPIQQIINKAILVSIIIQQFLYIIIDVR